PPLYPQYSHITKEVEEVVMRALTKEPTDRYPTVLEFACALESAIQQALLPQHSKQQSPLKLVTLQNSQSLIDPPKQVPPTVAPPPPPIAQTTASSPLQQAIPPMVLPPPQPTSQAIPSSPTQQAIPAMTSPPLPQVAPLMVPPKTRPVQQ